MTIEFTVEQAGCASCGKLIREALTELGQVGQVDVDEQADEALVALEPSGSVSQVDVDQILSRVSPAAGHAYRVRQGSWRPVAS